MFSKLLVSILIGLDMLVANYFKENFSKTNKNEIINTHILFSLLL